MMNQPILDRALSIVSAALVPVGALLVHHGVISSQDAVDVGSVWAAAVGAFHGGTAVQRARRRAPASTAEAISNWQAALHNVKSEPEATGAVTEPTLSAGPLTPYPDDLPPAGA